MAQNAMESVKMRNSKNLEEYLLQRNRSITKLDKAVSQEKLYLREKQYEPLFHSLSDIEKQHKKFDKKISDAIDILTEIESVLEELKL